MDEPVFCAETGRQIPSDPGSNVIPFRRLFEKPVLAIDNDEDAARYAQAMAMRTNVKFAAIDEAAKQEIRETAGRLAEEEDWI